MSGLGLPGLTGVKLNITMKADRSKVAAMEVDVLLNNAGIGYSGCLAEVNLDLARKNMEVNVFSSLELTQVAIRGMIERKRGTIAFVSSIGGRIAFPFVGPYCMASALLPIIA